MGDEDEDASAKAPKRLRLSVVDFNPGFVAVQGTTLGVDSKLLTQFKDSRCDDYTLVNCMFFNGEDSSHNPNKPKYSGIAPLGMTADADITNYIKALADGLHANGQQLIVGYTLDEGTQLTTTAGAGFNAWLAAASSAQIKAHAKQIVDFFFAASEKRNVMIDGIDFDLEIHGLSADAKHGPNLDILFSETARELVKVRSIGSVSYDNGTFQPNDGQGTALPWINIQLYAFAGSAPNMIARPMHELGKPANKTQIFSSIGTARRDKKSKGGELDPPQLQIMIDFKTTGDSSVVDICTTALQPNGIGLVLYNMGGAALPGQQGVTPLSSFITRAKKFDAALSPGAGPPGTAGVPLQVPTNGLP